MSAVFSRWLRPVLWKKKFPLQEEVGLRCQLVAATIWESKRNLYFHVVRDMRLTLTLLSIDFDSQTGPVDPSEWIKYQISCRYRSWEKVLDNGVVVTNPAENL